MPFLSSVVRAASALLVTAPFTSASDCHLYLGNTGNNQNMGPPTPGQTPDDCAATCLATQGCASFTFTQPSAEACYLHPVIDRNGVDCSSNYISGVCSGDDAQYDDPMVLSDGLGNSGVPLGGIGSGFFDIAPNGQFSRIAINNWHQDGVITDAAGSFLAVWRQSTGTAQVLQRSPSLAVPSLQSAGHSLYTGLFPTVDLTVSEPGGAASSNTYRISAWSPFVPHDVANSSLPLAFIDVELDNSEGASDDTFSVAFSWQDVIARQMFDASTQQLDLYYDGTRHGCGWQTDALRNNMANGGVDVPNSFPRVNTTAQPLQVPGGATGQYAGFVQSSAQPLQPNKFTLQHYNSRVAVLAEYDSNDASTSLSVLPAYPASSNDVVLQLLADAMWAPFVANGSFPTTLANFSSTPSYNTGMKVESASVLALRTTVPAGSTKTVRFVVSWFQQPDSLVPQPGADNRTYCGTGGYDKYYHNSFDKLEDLVSYAVAARETLLAETQAWHAPFLLTNSALPPWLSFKVINSAYTLFTNAILNKEGRFSMMEGGMGGLAGTQDQRMVAHIVYSKLFPTLDAQELQQFAATQDPSGYILHFDADFYAGIAGTDGVSPLEQGEYTDNTIGWLYQAAKSWQVTGNPLFLAFVDRVQPALDFLSSCKASPTFPHLISGSNTYDDFFELPLDSYLCSVYPLALEACRVLADASGNATLSAYCSSERAAAEAEFLAAMWNGNNSAIKNPYTNATVPYFAYGAQLDGSQRADDIMFGGQVAGAMLGRHAGWGDVGSPFNATQQALAAQLLTQVAQSYSFYAPKVWNLTAQSRAYDPRYDPDTHPSSTWPFYTESYTAIAAIQAGYVDDGLKLLKYIQLVDMRLGLTWSRNLWNPGSITYVAAPVSFFSLDVLSGIGLDVPTQTLYCSPYVPSTGQMYTYPVLLPQAFGVITVGGNGLNGTLTLQITRTFSDASGSNAQPVTISRVSAAPLGLPASSASTYTVSLPQPFVFAEGAVLDLSFAYATLVAPAVSLPPLLPATPIG
jgi:non-lysosomal glucosylceramidase